MSRPTAISPEEQEQIARRIGVLLLQSAGEDWQQLTVEYRATGEYHDLLGEKSHQDGSAEPWDPPEELLGIFEYLREGMYRPDVGTWLSALYVVERPSSYRIDINFDSEPQWQRPLPRAAYVDELRRYPRTEDNVPDWLREKLDGPAPANNGAEAVDAVGQPHDEPAGGAPHEDTARLGVERGDGASMPAYEAVSAMPEAAPVAPPREEQPVDPGSSYDGPSYDGPSYDSPSYDSPSYDSPSYDSAAYDDAARDGYSYEEQPTEDRSSDSQSTAREFRFAAVFDGFDEHARPLVSTRTPVQQDEVGALRQYLENAPIVSASRDNEIDQLDPEQPAIVPDTWHTDGVWLWQGAVSYYLTQYGVPPEGELLDHIRARRFMLTDVDDDTRDAAIDRLLERPATNDRPAEPAVPDDIDEPQVSAAENPIESTVDEGVAERAAPVELAESQPTVDDQPEPAPAVEETTLETSARRHGRTDDHHPSQVEAALSRLHDKLIEHDVDSDRYRVGSHAPSVPCLLQDGEDWIVTDPEGPELRFDQPEHATTYLFGALLISADSPNPVDDERVAAAVAPSAAVEPEPESVPEPEPEVEPVVPMDEAPAEPDAHAEAARQSAEAPLPESEPTVSEATPEPMRSEPVAGEPMAGETLAGEPVAPEPMAQEPMAAEPVAEAPAAEPVTPAEPPRSALGDLPKRKLGERPDGPPPGGHFLFTANQAPDGEANPPAEEAAPQSASAPQSAPDGDRTEIRPLPGEESAPQRPQDLPQRQPETPVEQAPPMQQGEPPRAPNPQQSGPMSGPPLRPAPSAPQGPGMGAPQRPGPVGGEGHGVAPQGRPLPPHQGQPGGQGQPGAQGPNAQGPAAQGQPVGQGQPAPGQQGGPVEQPHRPHPGQVPPGQPQPGAPGAPPAGGAQIQPAQGEPPLTLYRDRQQIVLQPGTEVDRFGESAGNVTYAVRTPYRHRSLPPQWATRPYVAYRVQRPMPALRGTAVPWFEQPGGGTAYVLPAPIADLLADGTLVELTGNEAPPRPSMD